MEILIFLLILALPAALILKYYDKKNPGRKDRDFFYGLKDFLSPRLFSKREEKVEKKVEIDYKFLIEIFILKTFSETVTYLTKYYPFSLFFQNRIFHYQYKKADNYVTKIKNKLDALPVLLDQDNHFFYLLYKQNELNFNKLKKEFKNENVFLSISENKLIKVAIPRV